MLILNERSPDKSLYVKGASLLEKLKKHTGPIHVTELFNAYAEDLQISFPQFLLTLDWLYLIGVLDVSEQGELQACF